MNRLIAFISLISINAAFAQAPSFEYCTATQLKYTENYFDGATGGMGGHGYMYIHGLCKDYTKKYPQVIPCLDVKESQYPHSGVGVSLDSDFQNVMWIAVPQEQLYHNGNQYSGAYITKREIDDLLEESYKLKVFQGVKLKSITDPKITYGTRRYHDAATVWSIGTDIAINWGRESRCIKTEITHNELREMTTFLNNQNDKYYHSDKTYKWSFLSNNCSHLVRNTLASAGMAKPLKIDQPIFKQIFNIANPANEYMYLVDRWYLNQKAKYRKKRNNSRENTAIYKRDVFPTNEMFKNDELKGFSAPRKNLKRMFRRLRYYDRYL
jgi:hypothetical protein